MCTVRLINSSNQAVETIETSARNFGQLKAEIKENSERFGNLNWDSSKVVLKDSTGKKGLVDDSDALSGEASYKIFIFPAKFDSGLKSLAQEGRELEAELAEFKYNLSQFVSKVAKVKAASCSDELTSEEKNEIRKLSGK